MEHTIIIIVTIIWCHVRTWRFKGVEEAKFIKTTFSVRDRACGVTCDIFSNPTLALPIWCCAVNLERFLDFSTRECRANVSLDGLDARNRTLYISEFWAGVTSFDLLANLTVYIDTM